MEYLLEYLVAGLLVVLLFAAVLLIRIEQHFRELLAVCRKWGEPPQAELDLRHGKYDDVIERCLADLERFPMHTKARLYLAQAYYGKEMWEEAKRELEVLSELAPSWQRDFTQPYLDKISQRVGQGGFSDSSSRPAET